jgi:hypothetical protein
MEEMSPKERELLGRLTDAENELIAVQQMIATEDPPSTTEIAMLATRLRVILLLLAEAKHYFEYEVPTFRDPHLQQLMVQKLAELRQRVLKE